MATPIITPQPVPLQSNYTSFDASSIFKPAQEGPRSIPFAVNWVADGGAGQCVNFAQPFTQVQNISQIGAVYVDNINCSVDVTLFFQDTQFRIDVPAYTEGLFPVVSNNRNFLAFTTNGNALAGDQTLFNVLNQYPYGVTLAKTPVYSSSAVSSVISLTATGNNNAGIPAGLWALRDLNVYVNDFTTATAQATVALVDKTGAGSTLFFWSLQGSAAPGLNVSLANVAGLNRKFTADIQIQVNVIAAAASGSLSVNIGYSS